MVCPAGTFTGDVRVPSGVTVIGQGMDETRLVGSLSWGSGTSVRDLAVGGPGDSHAPASYATADTLFERVRFYGGGSGGGVIGWNNRAVTGLTFRGCEFARNFGSWSANGGAGLLWFAVDTGQGTVIRDVNILDCHFGVSNGSATGSPTYGIVFWQSDEAGAGYWGDVLIEGNTFEVTAEFTLDFDGLETRSYHNDVVIRDNLIKGCGLAHEGGNAAWPYSICVEPSRAGTVIEDNVIGKGRVSGVKLTKGASDTVVRNNTFDYRTNNGVTLYYADFFRTISIFAELQPQHGDRQHRAAARLPDPGRAGHRQRGRRQQHRQRQLDSAVGGTGSALFSDMGTVRDSRRCDRVTATCWPAASRLGIEEDTCVQAEGIRSGPWPGDERLHGARVLVASASGAPF